MSILKLYDSLLHKDIPQSECSLESEFYDLWHSQGLINHSPIEQAVRGGALASSLPWVFTAGYQATLRNAFNILPVKGWAAFAATEDSAQPEQYPGTRLIDTQDGIHLTGCKSWVAHSKLVDTLIVTINDAGGDKYKARGVIVDRHGEGVSLSHRDNPKFLNRLSQGFARFENTPLNSTQVFEFEPIRQFGRTEAKFVMLASVAFMLSRSQLDCKAGRNLLQVGSALQALILEMETSPRAFAAVDLEFQDCVDIFEHEVAISEIPDYANDNRLFRMYSDRIQRRGKRASKTARSSTIDLSGS